MNIKSQVGETKEAPEIYNKLAAKGEPLDSLFQPDPQTLDSLCDSIG